MRIKPNLRVVWGLVSLESSHPTPQSSWRADRLSPRMGVRSQNFPGDSALPWVFPGEPCALVSRLEPDFQPTVLCILLWTLGSACRGTDQSDAPPCLIQRIPTLCRFLTQNTGTAAALSFPMRGHFRQRGSDTSSSPLAAPTTFSVFSNLLVTRV